MSPTEGDVGVLCTVPSPPFLETEPGGAFGCRESSGHAACEHGAFGNRTFGHSTFGHKAFGHTEFGRAQFGLVTCDLITGSVILFWPRR